MNPPTYAQLPSAEIVAATAAALTANGFTTVTVATKADALAKIQELIPAGASVMNGSSTTLGQIGFVDYLKTGQHGWHNLHAEILAEPDKAKQAQLRAQSVLADYFLGSVHAITQDGKTLTASASGSQLPAYAFTAKNVIWVASANKIVPTLADAFTRVEKYVFPLEDQRMKSTGAPGSSISKYLIMQKEIMPNRKVTMIVVTGETLGF